MIGARETVIIQTLGASFTDSEGRTDRFTDETTVHGRVDEVSAREIEVAAQRGQTHDLVVLVPPTTEVSHRDSKVVVSTPVRLAGTYKIDRIRTTRRHLRLLCSRTSIRD